MTLHDGGCISCEHADDLRDLLAKHPEPEPDAGDVEALAVELREREIARQLARDPECTASADTPRTIAADVLASAWLAARDAQRDKQTRAEALQEVAEAHWNAERGDK